MPFPLSRLLFPKRIKDYGFKFRPELFNNRQELDVAQLKWSHVVESDQVDGKLSEGIYNFYGKYSVQPQVKKPQVAQPDIQTNLQREQYKFNIDLNNLYKKTVAQNKANDLHDRFVSLTKEDYKGNIPAALDNLLRGSDLNYREMSLRTENLLSRSLRQKGPKVYHNFEILLKKPEFFKEKYGIHQDQLISYITDPDSFDIDIDKGLVNATKDIKDLLDVITNWNKKVVSELNAIVPIETLDFSFQKILGMPKKAYFNLGPSNFRDTMNKYVANIDDISLNKIIDIYEEGGILKEYHNFEYYLGRKLKFNNSRDEINFYKTVNGIGEEESLLDHILMHKKRQIKALSFFETFGTYPKESIRGAFKKLSRKFDAKELDEIYQKFGKQLDYYMDGTINVTSPFVEQLGQAMSTATSIISTASGGSVIRNIFDFGINKAAVTQAIYNPKYTLGGTVMEMLRNFGFIVQHATRTRNRKDINFVNKVLDIMGFGSRIDNLSHFNLLGVEDVWDVAIRSNRGSKLLNYLMRYNDALNSMSGNHQLADMARVKHVMMTNQLWTNMLDRATNYDEWFSSLSLIEKRQARYLNVSFGIGVDEFQALQKVRRTEISPNIPALITPESIMRSSLDTGLSYMKLKELANRWQNFMYISSLQTNAIPNAVDTITGLSGINHASSWMRLVLRPFLKFSDPAQAQMNRVANDIALNIYGDRRKLIGFDGSLVKYLTVGLKYLGLFMPLIWLREALYNRPFHDYTNEKALFDAYLQSGFGGYPMMFLSQLMFANSPTGGVYSQLPIATILRGMQTSSNLLLDEDTDDIKKYKSLNSLGRLSGLGTLWFTRGPLDYALQQALLTPYEKEKVRDSYNYYQEKKKYR